MSHPALHPLPLIHENRETWMNAAADLMRERIIEACMDATGDHIDADELAPTRWACAFPPGTRPRSAGSGKSTTIGLCIFGQSVRDGATELMVSPLIDDPRRVLDVMAHEYLHDILGPEAGHGPVFAAAAKNVGLAGKPTATVAGEAFTRWADDLLPMLGHYPHAAVNLTGRPKQGTRLVKVMCSSEPRCNEMPIRLTRKWLDLGMAPLCACCGEQMDEVA